MIGRLLRALPIDADDRRVIGMGAVLLVTLAVVVLALAGIAGAAVAVFQFSRGM